MLKNILFSLFALFIMSGCIEEDSFFCGQSPEWVETAYKSSYSNSEVIDYNIEIVADEYGLATSYYTLGSDTVVLEQVDLAEGNICYIYYLDLAPFSLSDTIILAIDRHLPDTTNPYLRKQILIKN